MCLWVCVCVCVRADMYMFVSCSAKQKHHCECTRSHKSLKLSSHSCLPPVSSGKSWGGRSRGGGRGVMEESDASWCQRKETAPSLHRHTVLLCFPRQWWLHILWSVFYELKYPVKGPFCSGFFLHKLKILWILQFDDFFMILSLFISVNYENQESCLWYGFKCSLSSYLLS